MLKIKDNVELKELEKFGFWKDSNFKIYNRETQEDYIEQFKKAEYLLILNKNRVIVKAKMKTVLTLEENVIHAYDIQTNRIKKYIPDLIQAGLVEKVKEE